MRNVAIGARVGDYSITRTLQNDLEATHLVLPRRARIRVADEAGAKQLMREACILEALRHPGVPRVYECGRLEDRRPWIALEMLDGPTLANAKRPLACSDALALLRDLGEVLHYVHMRGVVHCRIRPDLIVHHENGLCINAWGSACTHDGSPEITVGDHTIYLAPELARGQTFDARADIYSIGVIAYEALTGVSPERPLVQVMPALPRGVTALIDRMTSTTPLVRPNAAEVRAEAIRLLDQIGALTTDDDGIELIEVELAQDLSREPPPLPRAKGTDPLRRAP